MTAPVLTGFSPAVVFAENSVNSTPQLLDASVVFTDAEGDFNGGNLTLSGLLAEDSVSVRNEGTGAGQIGLSGANVTYGGDVIGTLAGGAGTTLTITFNAAATSAAIDALIQNLTYANVSDTPTADRTLVLNVTDAAGEDLTTTSFARLAGAANPFSGITVGTISTPTFSDLDGDGDLDLVVGAQDGTLRVWTNAAGVFSAAAVNPFNGIDVGIDSRPTFADLDRDGDLDLVAGAGNGTLRVWTKGTGGFTEQTGTNNPFNGFDVGSGSTPAFADLDGDGDLDLVVGASDGTLRVWANASGVFTQQTGFNNPFNGIAVVQYSSPTFADLDGDGDLDLVSGASGGPLRVWTNDAGVFSELTGTANPLGETSGLYRSAPTFTDLDGDGDLDLVVGDLYGTLSSYGNTTPRVGPITVTVTAENDAPTLTGFAPSITFAENTVNATPQLLDADVVFADAEGNFSGGSLTLSGLLAEDSVSVRNQGTAAGQIGLSGANVTYGGVVIGTLAGGAGTTLTITFNAAATSAAIDALIQNLTYANSSDTPTADRTLVLNVTDAAGEDFFFPTSFAPLTGAANPLGAIDVGQYSAPTFADLDGDGDLDLVVGEKLGVLRVWTNTDGVFTELIGTANPLNGIDAGGYSTPTFADLDGDGDLDLVVGDGQGTLKYWTNANHVFTEQTGAANPFNGIDVGLFSAPAFADLDGNGDLDLVSGAADGTLRVWTNTGGVFAAQIGTANPFAGIDVDSYSAPSFADLDGDGDLDLVVGTRAGTVRVWTNAGGVFTEQTGANNPFNGIDVGSFSTPTLADLDGDGDLDLVVGKSTGTVLSFENTTPHGQPITVTVT
ncbi:MAG: beta strand repeat-containing protein, partial [Paracoccaceae bacterium]